MKVRELFTDESKWTQHAFARDAKGELAMTHQPNASCFCLLGAVIRCYGTTVNYPKVVEQLDREVGMIANWNDNPSRTFADVKALVERLDI